MKIEEIDQWVIKKWIHGDADEAVYEIEKLVAVAKAAKEHRNQWRKLADKDHRTSQLLRTTFDPDYKPGKRIGLGEALDNLEQEE